MSHGEHLNLLEANPLAYRRPIEAIPQRFEIGEPFAITGITSFFPYTNHNFEPNDISVVRPLNDPGRAQPLQAVVTLENELPAATIANIRLPHSPVWKEMLTACGAELNEDGVISALDFDHLRLSQVYTMLSRTVAQTWSNAEPSKRPSIITVHGTMDRRIHVGSPMPWFFE